MNQSEKPYVPHTIAIDGPVASGKTTVGLLLAKELGYICLDTGIMYRAVAQKVLDLGISPIDEVAVTQVAQVTDIDVREPSVQDGRQFDVLIDGADRTWDIRTREVNACVSEVSVFPGVRDAMTLQQRRIAERSPIVMLGRDIGTVVLPSADLKIFLKASAMVRAKRRYEEERALGRDVRLEDVLELHLHRDNIDSNRQLAPLKPAKDAFIINTDDLDAQGVVETILAIIEDKQTLR